MIKKALFPVFLLSGIMLTACQQLQYIDRNFDTNEKTISVPLGYSGITGSLKLGLKRQGWTLLTKEGKTEVKETDTKTAHFAGNGRYNMTLVTGQRYFSLWTLSFRVNTVTCSVIDNKYHQEIFCYEGSNVTPDGATNRILKLIQENTK